MHITAGQAMTTNEQLKEFNGFMSYAREIDSFEDKPIAYDGINSEFEPNATYTVVGENKVVANAS